MSIRRKLRGAGLSLWFIATVAGAACDSPLFVGSFEDDTLTVQINDGDDAFDYHVAVGPMLDDGNGRPVMIVWAGAAGPGRADEAARLLRDDWLAIARSQGALVVAQVATGDSGGWIPSTAESRLLAILEDLQAGWSIDDNRIYGFGFSAGGHVMHDIALREVPDFAGYAIRAGALEAYAGIAAPADAANVVPLHLSVGISDSLLRFVREDRTRFLEAGWVEGGTLDYRETVDGHAVTAETTRDAWDFLCPKVLARPN